MKCFLKRVGATLAASLAISALVLPATNLRAEPAAPGGPQATSAYVATDPTSPWGSWPPANQPNPLTAPDRSDGPEFR